MEIGKSCEDQGSQNFMKHWDKMDQYDFSKQNNPWRVQDSSNYDGVRFCC